MTRLPDDARVTATPDELEAASAHTFEPGQFIAGRYRILRFIARGGMGEVYEVEDTELRDRVALKTLRAGLADDETLVERFRREISLAHRVTHANVCRLFDLGFHRTPRGRVTFLTMELLDGESLRRKLQRDGRMRPAEALPIVQQMVAGLAAAHAFDVVHRDFKSDNVMLVDSASKGARAVVTDFGLAHSTDGNSAYTTGGGRMRGTPAYMAPEQVQGGPITPAVDVYALGVVLYEMVTGALPFDGDDPMTVALRRLSAPPPSPRTIAADLDVRWERVILRCLERDPAQRFARIEDVLLALQGPTPIVSRAPLGRVALVVGGLALLIGGGWWWRAHRPHGAASRSDKPSVAVLGLRNLSEQPDDAWLGTALSELLSSELAAGGEVRRVPTESVSRLRRDLEIPDGGSLAPEVLERVRATVSADYVLGGSYLALPGDPKRLRLEVTLQDTRTGAIIADATETGSTAALFELVTEAGQRLRARLGTRAPSEADVLLARNSLPGDSAAARPYAEGLARLRLLDALGARPLLEQATAAAPDFPLAHAALSEVWQRLGHREDAEREARLAFERAANLPREEQLLVEANYRVARKEWPRAVELYRALANFFPSSIDYGVKLARVQVDAGQPHDALETLTRLRHEVANAERDPAVDVAEGKACQLMSDYKCQDAAGRRAQEKARALDAHELEANALLLQSYAAMQLGDGPRANKLSKEAYDSAVKHGNPFASGQALLQRARAASKTGDLAGEGAFYREAMAIFRKVGDDNGLASATLGLGNNESDLGHTPRALELYREVLPLYERTGNLWGQAATHVNLGQQAQNQGRFDDAEIELRRGLELYRQSGNRNGEAISLESLGEMYFLRGDLKRAAEMDLKGIDVATSIHDVTTVAQCESKLGEALHQAGEVTRAEASFKRAIASLEQRNERFRVSRASLRLARLYLDTGRREEADGYARKAVALQGATGIEGGETTAVLMRVLIASGRVSEARAALDRFLTAPHGELDLVIEAAAAELEVAEKQPARAVERLHLALARGGHAVPDRLAAELVLAEAERASGRAREARKRLDALAAEAKEKGFVLIARRAGLRAP
jgi:serine/threonine protein kinase/tetratricopeptide (TPR) repeat protein